MSETIVQNPDSDKHNGGIRTLIMVGALYVVSAQFEYRRGLGQGDSVAAGAAADIARAAEGADMVREESAMTHHERRRPVSTVADLNTLDEAEIVEGYRDALDGGDCGDNRSRSYWHGWRNGMIDRGRMPKDEHAAELAHEVIQHQRERGNRPLN